MGRGGNGCGEVDMVKAYHCVPIGWRSKAQFEESVCAAAGLPGVDAVGAGSNGGHFNDSDSWRQVIMPLHTTRVVFQSS